MKTGEILNSLGRPHPDGMRYGPAILNSPQRIARWKRLATIAENKKSLLLQFSGELTGKEGNIG
jgi:hypothetical protein